MPAESKSKIYFFFEAPISLGAREALKSFIVALFREEGKSLSNLNYIFCDDKALLAINRQYLNHDDYTDIISFELSDKDQPVEAEIYISVDRVRENAGNLQISIKSELHRVIFHGALHLCGYKDKKAADKAKMRSKEDFYLQKFEQRST